MLKEISDILQDAWEMPEDERTQIVKRLFMRWFPREDALQHLKSEVSRLGGCYDDLYPLWEELAKEHGSRRETYKGRFRDRYGSSDHRRWQNVPPSFCEKNPQPGEAKRWLRQAEADLESCGKEKAFTTDSFEWICFKCHQVFSVHFFIFFKFVFVAFVVFMKTKYLYVGITDKRN